MRRFIVTAVIIITGFLLQNNIFRLIPYVDMMPNILLLITAAFGFMRGKKEGMAVGAVCGLIADVFYGGNLGFHILIYTGIGYFNGLFYNLFFNEYIMFPLLLIAVSDLFYGGYVYVFQYLLRGRLNIQFYIQNVILPEMICTGVVSIVLYYILYQINHKLEEIEKRSAAKFV